MGRPPFNGGRRGARGCGEAAERLRRGCGEAAERMRRGCGEVAITGNTTVESFLFLLPSRWPALLRAARSPFSSPSSPSQAHRQASLAYRQRHPPSPPLLPAQRSPFSFPFFSFPRPPARFLGI